MADPTILTAMQELKKLLGPGNITTGNGFFTDVTTTEQKARMWHNVDDSEKPYVGIQLRTGAPEYNQVRQVFTDALVLLIVHFVLTDDEDAMLEEQMRFLDDVYRATASDVTLGKSVISTSVGPNWEVDAGDDIPTHTMRIELILHYRRPSGGS